MDSLFDFGDSTRANLAHVVSIAIVWKEMVSSTMPTSSYSILLMCLVFAIEKFRDCDNSKSLAKPRPLRSECRRLAF
jgi:hypothetical protein